MKEDELKKEPFSVTISSTWTNIKALDEWDKDCKANFGNCRWMKMWNDHLAAKREGFLNTILEKLDELKERIDKLEKKEKVEIKTLGGE